MQFSILICFWYFLLLDCSYSLLCVHCRRRLCQLLFISDCMAYGAPGLWCVWVKRVPPCLFAHLTCSVTAWRLLCALQAPTRSGRCTVSVWSRPFAVDQALYSHLSCGGVMWQTNRRSTATIVGLACVSNKCCAYAQTQRAHFVQQSF